MRENTYFSSDEHYSNFNQLMKMFGLRPGEDIEYEVNIYVCSHPDIYKCFHLDQLNLSVGPAWSLLDTTEKSKHKGNGITNSTYCLLQLAMSLYNRSEICLSTTLDFVARPDLFQTMLQALFIRANKPLNVDRIFDNLEAPTYSLPQKDIRETINLAFQAATMTTPTEEILGLLTHLGTKRAMEILLVLRQSPHPVKNINKFIEAAISRNWTPATIPVKKTRKVARMPVSDRTEPIEHEHRSVPFYNWLEIDNN